MGGSGRRWQAGATRALVVLSCVLVPVFWWRSLLDAVRPGGDVTFLTYDEYYYTLPALNYVAWMLHQGVVPLWTRYQLAGAPFLATQLHGMLYPPNWLVAVLPLTDVTRILLVGHYVIATGGAYWCARVFGASLLPALLAGVTYGMSGTVFNLGTVSMQCALVSAAWLPWQLALTRATLCADKWWGYSVGLGAAMAMTLLGGHPQYALMATHLCLFYAMAHGIVLVRRRGTAAVRRFLRFPPAIAVAVGLSAAQLAPTADLMLRSIRQPGMLGAAGAAHNPAPMWLPPAEVVQGLLSPLPALFGMAAYAHVGTLALVLAGAPLVVTRTRGRGIFLAVVTVAGLLIALGDHTPAYAWYLHVPGASLFRIPQRWTVVSALGFALLAGLGAESLRRARGVSAVVAIAVGLALLAGLWTTLHGLGGDAKSTARALAPLPQHAAWALSWIAAFALPRRWRLRPLLLVIAIAMSAHELADAKELRLAIPATHPDAVPVPYAAADFIRARAGLARVFTANPPIRWDRPVTEIPLKLGLMTGLSVISDYEPLADQRYAVLLAQLGGEAAGPGSAYLGPHIRQIGPPQITVLRLLGVGYVLARRDAGIVIALPSIYRDDAYEVFEIADPLPRAYVATQVHVAATQDAALGALVADPGFVLGGGVILDDQANAARASSGDVEITRYQSHEVLVHARLERAGVVVLNDRIDPYWRATVDGRAAPVLDANGLFRAVAVDAGEHDIRFVYRPTPVYVGAALSLLTLATLAARSAARISYRASRISSA